MPKKDMDEVSLKMGLSKKYLYELTRKYKEDVVSEQQREDYKKMEKFKMPEKKEEVKS